MVSIDTARKLAMSLPETVTNQHFDIPDFRVNNKIFATLHEKKNIMMVKLSLVDQSVFCSFDQTIIYPVHGGWGKKGYTYIELKKIRKQMLLDALTCAWKNTAPKKLVQQHFAEGN